MHLPSSDMHFPQSIAPAPGIRLKATKMLKRQIANLDVPEIPDFLDQIVAAAGHLWGCRMSANMNKLTMIELRNGVEGIISSSDCIEMTEGTQLLFI
jgi:peroxiredoxin family protein